MAAKKMASIFGWDSALLDNSSTEQDLVDFTAKLESALLAYNLHPVQQGQAPWSLRWSKGKVPKLDETNRELVVPRPSKKFPLMAMPLVVCLIDLFSKVTSPLDMLPDDLRQAAIGASSELLNAEAAEEITQSEAERRVIQTIMWEVASLSSADVNSPATQQALEVREGLWIFLYLAMIAEAIENKVELPAQDQLCVTGVALHPLMRRAQEGDASVRKMFESLDRLVGVTNVEPMHQELARQLMVLDDSSPISYVAETYSELNFVGRQFCETVAHDSEVDPNKVDEAIDGINALVKDALVKLDIESDQLLNMWLSLPLEKISEASIRLGIAPYFSEMVSGKPNGSFRVTGGNKIVGSVIPVSVLDGSVQLGGLVIDRMGQANRTKQHSPELVSSPFSGTLPFIPATGGATFMEAGTAYSELLRSTLKARPGGVVEPTYKAWETLCRQLAKSLDEKYPEVELDDAYLNVQMSHELSHGLVSAFRNKHKIPYTARSFDTEEHLAALGSMGGLPEIPLLASPLLYFFRAIKISDPSLTKPSSRIERFIAVVDDLVRVDLVQQKINGSGAIKQRRGEMFAYWAELSFDDLESDVEQRAKIAGGYRLEEWLQTYSPQLNDNIKEAGRLGWQSPTNPFKLAQSIDRRVLG